MMRKPSSPVTDLLCVCAHRGVHACADDSFEYVYATAHVAIDEYSEKKEDFEEF